MGARGKIGRGGVAERLANPAFKMASAAMADEGLSSGSYSHFRLWSGEDQNISASIYPFKTKTTIEILIK